MEVPDELKRNYKPPAKPVEETKPVALAKKTVDLETLKKQAEAEIKADQQQTLEKLKACAINEASEWKK